MEVDRTSSYTAAGDGFPVKLLQSHDAIDSRGRIVPLHPQIYPTNACNLDCSFCSCSARDRKLEISWLDTKQILVELFDLGAKALSISGGGEPLLLPHINEMIDLAQGMNMEIGLVTNGSLMSKLKVRDHPTWIRVSTSDSRDMNGRFWNQLCLAVENYHKTDWAFSYVLTKKPDYTKLRKVLAFAHRHSFTHVRIVSDLTDLNNVPEMDEVKAALAMMPGEHLVIYQGRKAYTKGYKHCLISLLKPVIGPDGGIWPCCGVQYALPKPSNDMEIGMRMGDWTDFRDIMQEQRCFNGSACTRCYYESYNTALDLLTRPIKHKEFV